MIEGLDAHNLEIRQGDKANTYIIVSHENGNVLGSANRLFNMKKADFNQQYESYINGQDTKFEPLEATVPVSSVENTPQQKAAQPVSEPSTPIPLSSQDKKPQPQNQASQSKPAGHWLGTAPIFINSEKSVAVEGMTQQERQAVHDFNERELQKDQQVRELLADQKKFAAMLNDVISSFQKRYQHLPPEPFAKPEYRDSHIIQKKIHEQLDPLRSAYHSKKSGWFLSAKEELKAFNDKTRDLYFKDFPGLNIINNQKDYDYVIHNMSGLYAASRQKKQDQWSSSIDVINYVNNKKDIDNLVSYIQETKDADLLLLASKSPALAIEQMKKQQKSNNNVIHKRNNMKAIKLKLEV
ncbi:hypothetical protein [Gluconobacter cerinus]|uniref:hypothetical protein n=1 Tax=Gluconobacter cerinus TaxID=38307 RepID=UPI001B8AB856|nr:hypothetical protein [Gluconobacter cerinus]MBS0983495.1 hypothetical protein [Gluconobacter cerinus]